MIIIGNHQDQEELRRELGKAMQEEVRLCLIPYGIDMEGDVDLQLARKGVRIESTSEVVRIHHNNKIDYELLIVPVDEGFKLERVTYINSIIMEN